MRCRYNGKRHPHIPKLKTLLTGLKDRGLEPPKVVVIDTTRGKASTSDWESSWESWDSFLGRGARSKVGRDAKGDIAWTRVDFNHPLWIMFSSGTTGTNVCCYPVPPIRLTCRSRQAQGDCSSDRWDAYSGSKGAFDMRRHEARGCFLLLYYNVSEAS